MTDPTVLVTGGAGYIGSHICKSLSLKGFLPVVYDSLCVGNAEAVKWGPLEVGDIRDPDGLRRAFDTHAPVAIVHCAALIRVGESVSDPASYYDNNVRGSLTLLEAARTHGVKNLVFSSTAAVYGVPQTTPIREDHPLNPINPYGQTKLAMENMIRDYASAYGMAYAILRYFNAAGADVDGELGTAYKLPDTHIIPLLMQTASGHRPEIGLFGDDYPTPDGTAVRDYIHVTDLAEAHVLALRHLLASKENLTLNLGTNTGHSVRETVEVARTVTGKPVPARAHPRRAGDPPFLVADATEAQRILGWTPRYSDLFRIMSTAWNWRQKQDTHGKTGAFLAPSTPFEEQAA